MGQGSVPSPCCSWLSFLRTGVVHHRATWHFVDQTVIFCMIHFPDILCPLWTTRSVFIQRKTRTTLSQILVTKETSYSRHPFLKPGQGILLPADRGSSLSRRLWPEVPCSWHVHTSSGWLTHAPVLTVSYETGGGVFLLSYGLFQTPRSFQCYKSWNIVQV